MSELAMQSAPTARAPWHLWLVAILSLLWNAAGAYVIVSAQSGATLDMDAYEIAYYAAQPAWFVGMTDFALLTALGGALALFLRSGWALTLYALSIAAMVVTTIHDISAGTSLLRHEQSWTIQFCLTAGVAVVQWAYALVMQRRRVLR
jgi:hypothetical protein